VTSAEACERLGVRSQTLYAYVSRGLLHPRREGRRSTFDVAELDALAARSRRSHRSGRLEVLIDTELTLLNPRGRLHYRGVDAIEIAGRWSYERTAEWLWSGADAGEPLPWPVLPAPVVDGARPADRVRAAMAVLAATAPPADRLLEAGPVVGRRAIQQVVGAVPRIGEERDERVASRLWARLSPLAATPARLRALDAALVLFADHELAASTVAARVAASTWAPPLDCVVAGLAAHAGVLHGGSSCDVEDALRHGRRLTGGYGHGVYERCDPRADALLPLVAAITPPRRWRRIEAAVSDGPTFPNADLAIAALAVGTEMVPGASEAVFAVARIAGWLAHAAEEHQRPFRFRPRASYRGLAPVDPPVR
jgi:citrate synthase